VLLGGRIQGYALISTGIYGYWWLFDSARQTCRKGLSISDKESRIPANCIVIADWYVGRPSRFGPLVTLIRYCTVSVVELVTLFEFAPMTVVPTPFVVATPATLGAFAMVATLATDELKCVVIVMS
jgi:hypothetical protein